MRGKNLKQSIINNISSLSEYHSQNIEVLGVVLESNEKDGTCTISYKGYNDTPNVTTSVPVRLSNPDIIGWFPKKNDYVLIRESAGQPIIIGDGNTIANRNKNKTTTHFKKNIFASIAEDLGGFLI